LLSTGWFQEGI